MTTAENRRQTRLLHKESIYTITELEGESCAGGEECGSLTVDSVDFNATNGADELTRKTSGQILDSRIVNS